MSDGWKYFDLRNLNELFHINFLKMKEQGLIEERDGMDTDQGLSLGSFQMLS